MCTCEENLDVNINFQDVYHRRLCSCCWSSPIKVLINRDKLTFYENMWQQFDIDTKHSCCVVPAEKVVFVRWFWSTSPSGLKMRRMEMQNRDWKTREEQKCEFKRNMSRRIETTRRESDERGRRGERSEGGDGSAVDQRVLNQQLHPTCQSSPPPPSICGQSHWETSCSFQFHRLAWARC